MRKWSFRHPSKSSGRQIGIQNQPSGSNKTSCSIFMRALLFWTICWYVLIACWLIVDIIRVQIGSRVLHFWYNCQCLSMFLASTFEPNNAKNATADYINPKRLPRPAQNLPRSANVWQNTRKQQPAQKLPTPSHKTCQTQGAAVTAASHDSIHEIHTCSIWGANNRNNKCDFL